jgi:hypothetical protein
MDLYRSKCNHWWKSIGAGMVDHKKLARLRQLITEGLRVQLGHDAITYINVGHAMEDISARQNHTIFARRG